MRLTSIEATPFHSLRYWTSGPGRRPRLRELPFVHAYARGLPEGVRSLVLVSDLQGREYLSRSLRGTERLLGEAVAEELSLLVSLGEISEISTILVCGDLYDYSDCRKPGGTGPVEAVFRSLSEVAIEVVGVLGNHDTLDFETPLPSCVTILDGAVIKTSFGMQIGGSAESSATQSAIIVVMKRPLSKSWRGVHESGRIFCCCIKALKTRIDIKWGILQLLCRWKQVSPDLLYSDIPIGQSFL